MVSVKNIFSTSFFCLVIHALLTTTVLSAESEKHSLSTEIEYSTGRLLINVLPSAEFTPEELANAISAKYIQVELRNPFKNFPQNFLDYPLVVISSPLEESTLHRLAVRFGYCFITISKGPLGQAIEETYDLLLSCPKCGSDLPHLSQSEYGRIYELMGKVDRIFKKNNIPYWATGGTLLGAIRHQGLMPWDDDLDICILDIDEKKLANIQQDLEQEGLGIYKKDIYKIFFKDGEPIENYHEPGTSRPWTFPSLDVFIMTLDEGKEFNDYYVHQAPYFYQRCGDGFYYSQIQSIIHSKFGPLLIPIPGDAETYLNDYYGTINYPDIWKYYAQEPTRSHKLERRTSIQGACFVKIDDFLPAPY